MCNYCGGKGIITDTPTITFCPHCIDARKLLYAIKLAIKEAKKTHDNAAISSLTSVNSFLPKYPVMAVLEAEAQHLPSSFVDTLRDTFGIRKLI